MIYTIKETMTKLIKSSLVTLVLGFSSIYASSEHTQKEEHSEHKASHNHDNCHIRLKNEVSKQKIEKVAIQEVERLILAKKNIS